MRHCFPCAFLPKCQCSAKYEVTLATIEWGPVPRSMSRSLGALGRTTSNVPDVQTDPVAKAEERPDMARPSDLGEILHPDTSSLVSGECTRQKTTR